MGDISPVDDSISEIPSNANENIFELPSTSKEKNTAKIPKKGVGKTLKKKSQKAPIPDENVSRNEILKSIQEAYVQKKQCPSVISIKSDMSNAQMWANILSNRIDSMPHERGKKLKLYMEVITTCCELELWDPPDPASLLDLLKDG